MSLHRSAGCAWLALAVVACGGNAPPPKAPEPAASQAAVAADPLAAFDLPAFPFEREAASLDFRRGLERTERFLAAPMASPPEGADQAAFEAWLKTDLMRWLTGSARELDQIQRALAPVAEGDEAEAIVASTLVALCWQRVHDHFVGLPAPPAAASDADELATYRDGLEQAAGQWLQQAAGTFAFCANRAGKAEDAALSPWQAYCAAHYEALATRMQALSDRMSAALERHAAAARGPRPPGSEACWTPSQGRGPARAKGEPATPAPALVLLDEVEPSRVPLLADERARFVEALEAALAERYAAAEVRVRWVDDKQWRALMAKWQRGQQLASGARCARGVSRIDFLRASHPNLELASAWVSCADDAACQLQVDLGDRGAASVLGYRRLRAKLATPLSDVSHWMQAIEALAPLAPGDRGGMLGGLGSRWRAPGGELVTLHRVELHGDWADAEAARAVVKAAALETCPAADAGRDPMAVLDVEPSGRVREVWLPPALSAARAQERCLERRLGALRFAAGQGVRRVGLTFSLGPGQGQSPRDAAYGAVDLATGVRVSVASDDNLTLSPAPLHAEATRAALAACFARDGADAAAPLELRVAVEVAPGGKAGKVLVRPLAEDTPAVAGKLARCLSRSLAATAFDCTSDHRPARLEATVCMVREEAAQAEASQPPAAAQGAAEAGGGGGAKPAASRGDGSADAVAPKAAAGSPTP